MDKEKLTYKVLKALKMKEDKYSQLDYSEFEATEEEIDNVISFLSRREYITGVVYADNRPYETGGVYLTEKGDKFLKDNRSLLE